MPWYEDARLLLCLAIGSWGVVFCLSIAFFCSFWSRWYWMKETEYYRSCYINWRADAVQETQRRQFQEQELNKQEKIVAHLRDYIKANCPNEQPLLWPEDPTK